MRKIIPIGLICILASALFSSCGSLSMTKRHYTKGYYFNYATRTHLKAAPQVTEKQIPQVANTSIRPAAVLPGNSTSAGTTSLTPGNTAIAAKSKRAKPNSLLQQATKYQTRENMVTDLTHVLQVQQAAPISEKISDDSNGRGLSLLWLVVVIILILWLIALAAGGLGLGGLLNILLVIALVLLILWLLRIA